MTNPRNLNLAETLAKLMRRRGIRFPWLRLPHRPSRPEDRHQHLWHPTGSGRLCLG